MDLGFDGILDKIEEVCGRFWHNLVIFLAVAVAIVGFSGFLFKAFIAPYLTIESAIENQDFIDIAPVAVLAFLLAFAIGGTGTAIGSFLYLRYRFMPQMEKVVSESENRVRAASAEWEKNFESLTEEQRASLFKNRD